MPLALVLLALGVSVATAQPADRPVTSFDYAARLQMPSVRLRAMGGLELAVRDEYTEINLWDFAGISSGLWTDRDSTHLDFWYESQGVTLDRHDGPVDREFARPRAHTLGLETAARSSSLVVGVDAGILTHSEARPFSDSEHSTYKVGIPVAIVNAAGNFIGATQWGLRGILGRAEPQNRFWISPIEDGTITLKPEGERAAEPNLFTPTDGRLDIGGIGGSLSYGHARYGSAAAYFDYRRDKLVLKQDEARNIYEESEPRDVVGYGAAVVGTPTTGVQVGVHAGREVYDSEQEYRFTVSGGSTDDPLNSRGRKLERDERRDLLRLRAQGDLTQVPLTIGGQVRVAYRRQHQSPTTGQSGDYNDFVLTIAANDTLQAPPLVEEDLEQVRTLEWGGGASYRMLEGDATIGAEYRNGRDALDGTGRIRTAKNWEVRAGGEYRLTPDWALRAGWRHGWFDEDDVQERDESVVDRVTAGVGSHLGKWRFDLGGHLEWWRTDYPDPNEAGGDGVGFSLSFGREF